MEPVRQPHEIERDAIYDYAMTVYNPPRNGEGLYCYRDRDWDRDSWTNGATNARPIVARLQALGYEAALCWYYAHELGKSTATVWGARVYVGSYPYIQTDAPLDLVTALANPYLWHKAKIEQAILAGIFVQRRILEQYPRLRDRYLPLSLRIANAIGVGVAGVLAYDCPLTPEQRPKYLADMVRLYAFSDAVAEAVLQSIETACALARAAQENAPEGQGQESPRNLA